MGFTRSQVQILPPRPPRLTGGRCRSETPSREAESFWCSSTVELLPVKERVGGSSPPTRARSLRLEVRPAVLQTADRGSTPLGTTSCRRLVTRTPGSHPGDRMPTGYPLLMRSCGKRHNFCRVCNPAAAASAAQSARKIYHLGVEAARKADRKGKARTIVFPRGGHLPECECLRCNQRQGQKSPCWRGGPGYDWDGVGWKAARQLVWKRDKVCRVCGGPPRGRRLDVHHIVARRDGGTNELANLVGVHQGHCHKLAEAGKVDFGPIV